MEVNNTWTLEERQEFRTKQKECLDKLVAILDREGVPYFLSSGTLLGAIRDGEFLLDDSDHDIGILSEHWSPRILSILQEEMGQYYYKDVGVAAGKDLGLGLHQFAEGNYKRKRIYVDLEVYTPAINPDGDECFVSFSIDGYEYPHHVLASGTVLHEMDDGAQYPVLAYYGKYLDTCYGDDWSEGRKEGFTYMDCPNRINGRQFKKYCIQGI